MESVIFHKHTGTDAPQVDGKDLGGFAIFESIPTHTAEQGTLVIGNDSGYKLYCMINGTWTAL